MTQGPTDEPVRLGRYELLGEIASGGMATVFLARSTGAGGFTRIVAIKRLHPHLEAEEEFVQMFLDEARLAARIRHPNVVGTIDVEDRDGLYIVMEFIEGVTLLQLAREAQRAGERIPVAVAMRIVLDTLAGLHAAHELRDENDVFLNLVHRDVSPQNVLLGTDGTARLSDFGIAKANARLSHTRDGQLKGKISYMAPEQTRRGETIDRRADIFAMGAVVWEALAGRRLFQGESDVEVLNQLLFEPIPRLKDFAPTLPSLLEGAVMKALDRDPAARYATAAQFGEALERAARMLGGAANHRVVAAFIHRVAGERIAKERTRISLGSIPADAPLTGSLRASLTPAPPPTPSLRPSTNPGTERQAAPRARLRAPTMTGPVFSRARESVAPAESAPARAPAEQPLSVEHPPLTEDALADATIANAPAPARPRPSLRAPTLPRGVNVSAGSIPSVPPPPAPSLPAVIDFDISEDPDAVPVPAPAPLRASTRPSLLPPAEAPAEPVAPTPDDSQRLPAIELSYENVPAAPPAPTPREEPLPPSAPPVRSVPPPTFGAPAEAAAAPEPAAPAALPLPAEPAGPPPSPPPPRRGVLGMLALGLLVLVAALGGLFAAGLIDPLGSRTTETPAPPRPATAPDAAPAPPADATVAATPADDDASDASDDDASDASDDDASDASDVAASDASDVAASDASDDAASDAATPSDASDASDDAASDAATPSDADRRRHHRRRRRNGATP